MRIHALVCHLGILGASLLLASMAAGFQADSASNAGMPPIVSVLAQRCLGCHAGDDPAGGLDLTRPSRVLRGDDPQANPAASDLWRVIDSGDMPQDGELTADERAIFQAWIAAGAPCDFEPIDPLRFSTQARAGYDWWAWQPLREATPPPVHAAQRVRNPIDHFVLARLEAEGMTYSAEAAPRHQVRRLFFDLIGLPPPPEVVAAFEANPSDAAYTAIVDSLLNSAEYGERWGRHWLDIVRYGESDGFERNGPRREAWPYRDWVIDSLNADLPFDDFARRQIAGDLCSPDPVDGAAATGFLVSGVHNTVVGASRTMQLLARQDELEDLIGAIGQTFLGLTVNCARCHDHKFDPLTQREYYQLVATLAGVQHGVRQLRDGQAQQELDALQARQAELHAVVAALEQPVRERILTERRKARVAMGESSGGFGDDPREREGLLAAWDFQQGLVDQIGGQTLALFGEARLAEGGLQLDGDGDYAASPPLAEAVTEKTLEALILLADLEQGGGAALSLETLDGGVFDAIVFAEQEPQRWMAGSNGFVRTRSLSGIAESLVNTPVHLALSYAADGKICAFRNGIPYGQTYVSSGLQTFPAAGARLLLGLRHSPPGGNRFFRGTLLRARLFGRVRTPEQIGAAAGALSQWVSRDELQRNMASEAAQQHAQALAELEQLERDKLELESVSLRTIYTCRASPPEPTHVLPRGDVLRPGDVVEPALPSILALAGIPGELGRPVRQVAEDGLRRWRLANWLTASENPLFHRVIANRLWHYHFGRGLVATPSDLGFNGGVPSHPELLDWLAIELQQQGMRLKPLHRLIVTSSAYRQGSGFSRAAHGRDADNRWLWRRAPLRLDAEVVRDAMLWASGQLNSQRGGPGFDDVRLIDQNNGTTYYEPLDRDDPQLNRRTIYRFTPRGGRSALLDSLDCPDPSTATPRRSVTTTPLQALSLQNNDLVIRLSQAFGDTARSAHPEQLASQVDWMFWRAYGRAATEVERTAAADLGRQHGLAAVARALFNSNEFMIVQ